MAHEKNIRNLVEFILQNIEKVSSPGLYNGKAGLSLALFTASKHLQDEHLEDIAFSLLQESLITKNNDNSFENGIAGIGYAILYLIENKYIEADFNEIFEEQYEFLLISLACIEKEPLKLLNSLQIIYFLSKVSRIKYKDDRVQIIIKKYFEGLELYLTLQFHDFDDIYYINKKYNVLNIYNTYLRLINYSNFNFVSQSLLRDYAALYEKGRILSSLEIGYYLNGIATKYNIKGYEHTIEENISNGIKNIYLDTLSLKERINLAQIANCMGGKTINEYDLLPEIDNIHTKKIIQDLLLTVEERSLPLCYGGGLGRLLLYCVDKQTELL